MYSQCHGESGFYEKAILGVATPMCRLLQNHNKALALQTLDKSALAIEAVSEAIKFATFTEDPSNTDVALSGKARLQLVQGNFEDALEWLSSNENVPFDATALWCIEVPAITRCRLLIANGQKEDSEEGLNLLLVMHVRNT